MARTTGDSTVTLSVLDRLIDREPNNSAEAPLSRAQSVRVLKNAVRRDLEWLMNTRCVLRISEEALDEVGHSLYTYGLPDFSSYSIASTADQSRLLREILTAIKVFEPRLANVRVVPLEDTFSHLKQVRLRIDAMLLMEPTPEPISFDTFIELRSGVCRLTGDSDAR